MQHAKRTGEGRAERLALVNEHFCGAFGAVRASIPRRLAADDDILDAFAALWTAERIFAVRPARSVPSARSWGRGWVVFDVLTGLVPIVIDAATNSWSQTKGST